MCFKESQTVLSSNLSVRLVLVPAGDYTTCYHTKESSHFLLLLLLFKILVFHNSIISSIHKSVHFQLCGTVCFKESRTVLSSNLHVRLVLVPSGNYTACCHIYTKESSHRLLLLLCFKILVLHSSGSNIIIYTKAYISNCVVQCVSKSHKLCYQAICMLD